MTLYAKWTINSYTVTFNTDGASKPIASVRANYGDGIPTPVDPTKTDHLFSGWYRDADFAAPWNFAIDKVTDNITLHVKWSSIKSGVVQVVPVKPDPKPQPSSVGIKVVLIDGKYYAQINSMTNSTYSVIWNPVKFKDVEGHWAKDAVNDMGSRIVISGAIQAASGYGLIDGYGDGAFKPTDKITREQAMMIIAKAMSITGLSGKLSQADQGAALAAFTDAGSVSEWAKSAVADCIQAGIVTGKNGNQLAAKSYISRAEVAAIVQRLLQKSDLI